MLNERFVNMTWQEEWLWKDATKVTSGFVGEHYFEKTYLQNNDFYEYSTGWYHCYFGQTDVPIVFFLGEKMTELDQEILSKFGNEYYFCQAFFNNGLNFVYYDKNAKRQGQGFPFSENQLIDILGLTKLQDSIEAPAKSKNRDEFNSYINYFKREHILNNVFLDRYFCNGFLVKYFRKVVDFDFIIKNSKDEFIIADTKFRYPICYEFTDRKYCYFGINVAPGDLYKKLSNSFKVYNFNFIKPKENNENLDSFISNGHLKHMYYGDLNIDYIREDNIFPKKHRDNSKGTDYTGEKQTPYYRFPIREYTYKNLSESHFNLPF